MSDSAAVTPSETVSSNFMQVVGTGDTYTTTTDTAGNTVTYTWPTITVSPQEVEKLDVDEAAAVTTEITARDKPAEATEELTIVKTDEDRRLVFGWANQPEPITKKKEVEKGSGINGAPLPGSIEEVIEDVDRAYRAQFPDAPEMGRFTRVIATFEDRIIAHVFDETALRNAEPHSIFLEIPYTREDSVTFGDAVEVEPEFVAKILKGEHSEDTFEKRSRLPKVDLQGDMLPMEVLEEAVYEFVLNSRVGGSEHKRAEKSVVQVARVVESFVVTDEKLEKMGIPADMRASIPRGWWIGFKVDDDDVWEAVKSGRFKAFSIGGRAVRNILSETTEETA